MSKFKHGMYGGKFLPLHKGHKFCIDYARIICDWLTAILFINGDDEIAVSHNETEIAKSELEIDNRIAEAREYIKQFDNVDLLVLDCQRIYETLPTIPHWDAETPFVQACIYDLDVVFSSEPSYGDYFSRAYPYAKHILIDPPRINVPISATDIRAMTTTARHRHIRIKVCGDCVGNGRCAGSGKRGR